MICGLKNTESSLNPFMDDNDSRFEKYKIPIALSLIGVVLIIGGLVSSNFRTQNNKFPQNSLIKRDDKISVDVSGAVNNPGVYKLNIDSRVEEAIEVSGGFTDEANTEYISKYLNMALKLSDGMKIYVPFKGEQATGVGQTVSGVVAGVNSQKNININTATQSELESLPGVGAVTASKIISGRPYSSVEELLSNKVVGKSIYEKIKNSISVY